MSMSVRPAQQRRLLISALLLTSIACADGGGGGGCGGGCGDGCGLGASVPYPNQGNVIDQSVQLRLTPQGLGFLEDNAAPLISTVLGDAGLSFCVPPSNDCGVACYCNVPDRNDCGDQGPGCLVDADIDSLEIAPTATPIAEEPAQQ